MDDKGDGIKMERPQLNHEIESIHNELLVMGSLVEEAIINAIHSLKTKDIVLAQKVIDDDSKIDELEDIIEDKCLKFIARQQPLAGDLRYVLSILKMITDLERIGDHCEDIAKYTLKLADEKYIKELIEIPKMADLASKMVNSAIDAFVNRNPELARKVWKMDEEMDEIFQTTRTELLGIMEEDQSKAMQSVTFIFIASHIERIADYATNICEKTVFSAEGNYQMD